MKLIFKKKGSLKPGRHNAFPTYIKYKNQEYLAFRVSKNHFPSKSSCIAVYKRSKIQMDWELLKKVSVKDLDSRDPELGIIDDALCMVFSAISLREISMYFTTIYGNDIAEPIKLRLPGLMPSKFINLNKHSHLLAYRINKSNKDDIVMVDLTAKGDVKNIIKINKIYGTETDLIQIADKIYGVSRVEKFSENGSGAFIFVMNSNFKLLNKKMVDFKLDSPELFELEGRIFLLSRSTNNFKGKYNIFKFSGFWILNTLLNMIIYWFTGKKLSLYEIGPDLSLMFKKNLNTFGDTGYSVKFENRLLTYSSISSNKNISWIRGQFSPTEIVEYEIIK